MCGVFGWVANPRSSKGPDIPRLQEIARVTMKRGAHAFGFSWIDQHGVLRMYKQSGRIVDYLGLLRMARGARMLIGHCRHATHGSPADNGNNHPHPVNGGWYVHNGKIMEHREIVREFGLHPMTDCDSEVLGLLAEINGGTNSDRLATAVAMTEEAPLVTLGIWRYPRLLTAIRRGHPLHYGVRGGAYYLGSLAEGLPGAVAAFPDNSVTDFTPKGISHAQL